MRPGSNRRIPLWSLYKPEYPRLTIKDFPYLTYIVFNLMQKHLFKLIQEVQISTPGSLAVRLPNGLGFPLGEIIIKAINPANKNPWIQYMFIYSDGSISTRGGQLNAAWLWKLTYLRKIARVLSNCLTNCAEENLAKIRQIERVQIFTLELIEKVFSPYSRLNPT